jgi:MFS superfamily sulfate permease-like transporter
MLTHRLGGIDHGRAAPDERRRTRLADAAITCATLPLVVSVALAIAGIVAGEPRLLALVVMAAPLAALGWIGRRHAAAVGAFLAIAGTVVAIAYPLLNAGLATEIVIAVEASLLLPAVAAGLLFLRLSRQVGPDPRGRPSGAG